jgi:hypothetical protein
MPHRLLRSVMVFGSSAILALGCDSENPAPPAGPSPADSYFESLQVSVVDNGQPLIQPGQSRQFIATGRFADGSSFDYTAQTTWDSSDPKVATVSPAGLVTGVAEGRVTIRGSYGEKSGTLSTEIAGCRLRVTPDTAAFNAFGGKADIQVTPNYATCGWTAKSDAPWLRVSGQPRTGSGLISLTIPENSTPSPRTAIIQFGRTEAVPGSTVRITQEQPVSCSYVTDREVSVLYPRCWEGYYSVFTVVAHPSSCRWNLTIPSWMTALVHNPADGSESGLSGQGTRTVSYRSLDAFAPNHPLSATILVSGLSGQNPPGRLRVEVDLSKSGNVCLQAPPPNLVSRP